MKEAFPPKPPFKNFLTWVSAALVLKNHTAAGRRKFVRVRALGSELPETRIAKFPSDALRASVFQDGQALRTNCVRECRAPSCSFCNSPRRKSFWGLTGRNVSRPGFGGRGRHPCFVKRLGNIRILPAAFASPDAPPRSGKTLRPVRSEFASRFACGGRRPVGTGRGRQSQRCRKFALTRGAPGEASSSSFVGNGVGRAVMRP